MQIIIFKHTVGYMHMLKHIWKNANVCESENVFNQGTIVTLVVPKQHVQENLRGQIKNCFM